MTGSSRETEPLSLVECLEALHAVRRDEVVIAAMAACREWMRLGSHPLDIAFVPSSMGQASSLGLGIALARPDRRVVVLNGDGSLLMNLGSLVTIAAEAPPNLTMIVFDNGVYEITGAQPTPAAALTDALDYVEIARSCGIRSAMRFETIEDWRRAVAGVIATPGPHFVHLRVAPMYHEPCGPKSPGPPHERARAFAAALAGKGSSWAAGEPN